MKKIIITCAFFLLAISTKADDLIAWEGYSRDHLVKIILKVEKEQRSVCIELTHDVIQDKKKETAFSEKRTITIVVSDIKKFHANMVTAKEKVVEWEKISKENNVRQKISKPIDTVSSDVIINQMIDGKRYQLKSKIKIYFEMNNNTKGRNRDSIDEYSLSVCLEPEKTEGSTDGGEKRNIQIDKIYFSLPWFYSFVEGLSPDEMQKLSTKFKSEKEKLDLFK